MTRDFDQFPKDDNGDVLWQMRSKGDSLAKPREIDFTAIFPSGDTAVQFAVVCLRDGFKVEMERCDQHHDDGLNWNVVVYCLAVPTYAGITALEQTLEARAASSTGRVNGWSSVFVPAA